MGFGVFELAILGFFVLAVLVAVGAVVFVVTKNRK